MIYWPCMHASINCQSNFATKQAKLGVVHDHQYVVYSTSCLLFFGVLVLVMVLVLVLVGRCIRSSSTS